MKLIEMANIHCFTRHLFETLLLRYETRFTDEIGKWHDNELVLNS